MSDYEEFENYDSDQDFNENYSDYNDEFKLMDEINVLERIGGKYIIQFDKQIQNSTDRFKLRIYDALKRIDNNFNDSFYNELISKIEVMQNEEINIDFINATAYILGYYIVKNSRYDDIDENIVESVFNNTLINLDNDITKPDIIRYSRFHLKLKKLET